MKRAGNATASGEGYKSVSATLLRSLRRWVSHELPAELLRRAELWYQPRILPAGVSLWAGLVPMPVSRDSVLVFVDAAPGYNWAHAARVIMFDPRTRRCEAQYPANLPPHAHGLDLPPLRLLGPAPSRRRRRLAATTAKPTTKVRRRRASA